MRINGAKLVYELAKKEMTQKQVAEICGVSRVTINNVRNGLKCSEELAGKLAKALGVEVTDILE
ncbi:helix-turn-helix transcriptional regulator [Cuneatibacter caecimuris]|uniref:DNA-binding XRE family transcriptional regulator n=1 Tax=Cuneatibacter caecimuris TaxID=1796618 RepID=A0A4Q7PPY4_9FIRM|nr:helix-turn-helix transcriptional regulator [Cuneatibacter caecimuris]RZT02118.1 DNA-binding XRE family transcriptional regulator [Cuneatibacter caecimuris]